MTACLFEVAAASRNVGYGAIHRRPESVGVVSMDKVSQLVDHHTFQERGLEHHDTPVEAQGPVGCAAAPTGTAGPVPTAGTRG